MWMLAVVDGDEEAVARGKNKAAVMPGGTGLSGAWGWGIPDQLAESGRGLGIRALGRVSGRRAAARPGWELADALAPYEDEEILAKYPWLPQAGEMITQGKGLPAVTKQDAIGRDRRVATSPMR